MKQRDTPHGCSVSDMDHIIGTWDSDGVYAIIAKGGGNYLIVNVITHLFFRLLLERRWGERTRNRLDTSHF